MRIQALTTLSLGALMTILFAQAPVQAQEELLDLSRIGPQVGERVPDFSLQDQNGRVRTLQSIMGPNGAMIVFVRSADW